MIRNIINLSRIFLISAFNRGGNRKRKNSPARYLLIALLFAYLIGVCSYGSYVLLDTLIAAKQEDAFVALLLMGIITLVMFTTIISCMNVLYFSDDNRFILPLPLKPLEVLSAKLNSLLVYVYMEELMVAIGPLCIYGYMTGKSFLFYPLGLLVLLFIPIVPLLIAVLIVMIAMAFTKGIRNKNLVQMITMTISIVFTLMISTISSQANSTQDAMVLLEKANGLVEIYKKAFVTMPMAVDALTKQSLLSSLLLILISAAAYVLVCLFGQKLYYRGMLGSLYSSSGVSDKKIDEKNAFNSRGLAYSYVWKEMMVYLRRPTFFVQLILPCLILPAFMMIVMYVSVGSSVPGGLGPALSALYQLEDFEGVIYAVVLLVIMFISLYCFISMIAISKDGHDAYAMKYLPISFYKQLIYKMIPDIGMCFFAYLGVAITGSILYRLPLIYVLFSLPVALLYSILHGFLILTDVRRPKLDWTNELQIVKKNMRMMLGMVFSLMNMGLVGVLAFVMELSMPMITLVLSIIYLLLDVILYRYIKDKDLKLADGFE
ncbi:MAG: hypothetical protein K6A70_09815 [Erysipelotrichaceae bacterium]|nr:hypothetical protein [Erysipelotrichaceae bacterium]